MKGVVGCLMLFGLIVSSCQKEKLDSDVRISARLEAEGLIRPPKPVWPDTPRKPVLPKLPRLPLVPREGPVLLNRCVYSYAELVDILGTPVVQADAVILDGGPLGDIRLDRSVDLPAIWYTAIEEVTGSSLFRSKLQVEWRPDPSVYFSGFGADVWSAGCVYNYPSLGAFTNILKGGVEVLINTCIFWSVGPYAGLRIKYLVIN